MGSLTSMYHRMLLPAALFFLIQCSPTQAPVPELRELSLLSVVGQLPPELVNRLAKAPAANGALGLNKDGYFHVRFQISLAANAAYAVYFREPTAVESVAKSIAYSFTHQKPDGDFEIQVPASLQSFGTPSPADLASGTAFFGSALASTLHLLDQSAWFKSLSQPGKQLIDSQRQSVQRMTDWLKSQSEVLMQVDHRAANRLLWDAHCFFGLGVYLEDATSKELGEEFLRAALQRQASAGYFTENEGFDSSYNGVSLLMGLQLYTLLPPGQLKRDLGAALVRAAEWQKSRILPSGEITTAGNTRVFPGGEQFLGAEKNVAWVDTVQAFYWLAILTDSPEAYRGFAEKIRSYYE